MVKWRLMLTTLPFVLLVLAVKLGLHFGLNFGGIVKFADLGVILTGGVFLIGFMLAGTMADYKESEKLPGELICSLEAIEEGLCHISQAKQNIKVPEARQWVMNLTTVILDWLYRKFDSSQVYAELSELSAKVQPLDSAAMDIRVQNEIHAIRKVVTRIDVIVRTSFIQSGYALLDTIVGLVLVLLVFAKFDTVLSEIIVTMFVSLIYIYMIRLIRDIDDPFEYKEGKQKGATEVDLFPINEFRARLQERLKK
jgi:hypothetical protein